MYIRRYISCFRSIRLGVSRSNKSTQHKFTMQYTKAQRVAGLRCLLSKVPLHDEEVEIIKNKLNSYHTKCEDENIAEKVCKDLLELKVDRHFLTTASHRKWVKNTFNLFQSASCESLPNETVIKEHDLSKYGPEEAVGYGLMFGRTGKFRQLEGIEKVEWEKALQNHYKENSHHPENVKPKVMPLETLSESLIDMLACKLERDLKGGTEGISVDEIFLAPTSVYYKRYTEEDKLKVLELSASWQEKVQTAFDKGDLKVWCKETGAILVPTKSEIAAELL